MATACLWAMLPPGGVLPALPSTSSSDDKFPWFRLEPGSLQVTGERLDGPTGDFSASPGDVSAYGATGLIQRSDVVVTRVLAGDRDRCRKGSLTITMRVEASPP